MSSGSPHARDEGHSIASELNERWGDVCDENGVDRSLIRWSLSQSPTERVMTVEESLNALATLRRIRPPR